MNAFCWLGDDATPFSRELIHRSKGGCGWRQRRDRAETPDLFSKWTFQWFGALATTICAIWDFSGCLKMLTRSQSHPQTTQINVFEFISQLKCDLFNSRPPTESVSMHPCRRPRAHQWNSLSSKRFRFLSVASVSAVECRKCYVNMIHSTLTSHRVSVSLVSTPPIAVCG